MKEYFFEDEEGEDWKLFVYRALTVKYSGGTEYVWYYSLYEPDPQTTWKAVIDGKMVGYGHKEPPMADILIDIINGLSQRAKLGKIGPLEKFLKNGKDEQKGPTS